MERRSEHPCKRGAEILTCSALHRPSFIRLRPSHNFPFLNNQTCCLDTFMTKACFYHFFLHQTQSKHYGNVRQKAWRTLFTPSPVSDLMVHPSTWEVGRGVGAASYTQTSTDSDSTLLSACVQISSDWNRLDSFSLINPQQSVKMHRTEQDQTAGKTWSSW